MLLRYDDELLYMKLSVLEKERTMRNYKGIHMKPSSNTSMSSLACVAPYVLNYYNMSLAANIIFLPSCIILLPGF